MTKEEYENYWYLHQKLDTTIKDYAERHKDIGTYLLHNITNNKTISIYYKTINSEYLCEKIPIHVLFELNSPVSSTE